jgi:hypothetical protein
MSLLSDTIQNVSKLNIPIILWPIKGSIKGPRKFASKKTRAYRGSSGSGGSGGSYGSYGSGGYGSGSDDYWCAKSPGKNTKKTRKNKTKKCSSCGTCGSCGCSDYDSDYDDWWYYNYGRRFFAKNPVSSTTESKYMIVFKNTVVDVDDKINSLESTFKFKHTHKYKSLLKGFSVSASPFKINSLLNDPDISFVEKDTLYTTMTKETLESQLVANTIQWNNTMTNTIKLPLDNFSTIHAYVVDSGILATHNEFSTGQVVLDYNAITSGTDATDDNGHGTAVASLIGGINLGTATNTTLHAIKVLDSTGSGYTSDIISGLEWIMINKKSPCVINMSLGGDFSASVNLAVQNCIAYGIPVVVAAGNSGIDASTTSPASAVGAMVVAAHDSSKTKPTWSNFGSVIFSFAPGVSILTAWGTGTNIYYNVSGTSISAPIETGIVVRYIQSISSTTKIIPTPKQIYAFLNFSGVKNEIINPGKSSPNVRAYWNPALIGTPIVC